jgi:hypothetical protein
VRSVFFLRCVVGVAASAQIVRSPGGFIVTATIRFYHQTCGVGATLWVLIFDYYSIAVGGWAYLIFLVTPEARFAEQN